MGLRSTAREEHLVPAALEASGSVPGAVGKMAGAIAPVACNALKTQLGSLGDWFFLKGLCSGGFLARHEKKTDVEHLAQLDLGNPAPLGRDGDKVAFHAALTADGPLPVDVGPSTGEAGAGGGGVDGGAGNGHGKLQTGVAQKDLLVLEPIFYSPCDEFGLARAFLFSFRHRMDLIWR